MEGINREKKMIGPKNSMANFKATLLIYINFDMAAVMILALYLQSSNRSYKKNIAVTPSYKATFFTT